MQINEGLLGARARAGFRMLIAAVAVAMFAPAPANASSFKVLHSFCKKVQCGDGEEPAQALAIDQAGNLYGTAAGGAHGQGIVFELVAPTTGKKWQYRTLYHFCALSNCADGRYTSNSTLVVDAAGNVYGTTFAGGAGNDTGTVFELSPSATGNHWSLHTLYNFCASVSSCHDGENPDGGLTYAGREAGLPYDGTSPLFGTTSGGGGHFGGVAYALTPETNGRWKEQILYAFCQVGGGQVCADGRQPAFQPTVDSSGNIYGNTFFGGASGEGVAFKLAQVEGQKRRVESVLYSFCSMCSDSGTTLSGLTTDLGGDLVGTSWRGGTSAECQDDEGCGLVYRITTDGTEAVVYAFCALPDCRDGDEPLDQGGLAIDAAGNLFGTTAGGGSHNGGTVFKLTASTLQVLHSFCGDTANCLDGAFPRGGVIEDSSGRIFGTTQGGGAYGEGTAFELTP